MELDNSNRSSVYFAADEADQCVAVVLRKADDWFNALLRNRYLDKIRKSWCAYHGAYTSDGHDITFSGEQGELLSIAVNHYRNIAENILRMVTATRPAFQPRATNTDYRSQVQTTLASGLLDYYMREKRLERYLRKSVEYAIVLAGGFIKMEWNSTSGKIYDTMEPDLSPEEMEGKSDDEIALLKKQKAFPIYEGDVQFTNLSPYDVVFDTTKESYDDNDWVLCRSFKNKYDLAAKYPEYADKIIALTTKSEKMRSRVTLFEIDKTVDISVYEFYHKSTESVPDGRYMLFLASDIILMDTRLPYRSIPVYRIVAADILGTAYGYTGMWDLLPLQEAVNSTYSTVLTNQNTFGVQNILNPRGNDVRMSELEGGLNFIEYNAQVGKPEAMNLTQTPPEIFNFLGMLEKAMETISGINSVARGNVDEKLSGAALALIQSQAIQFINGLQQQYIQLIEDVGTGLLQMLRDFAVVPRIAAICGADNKAKMKEFTGDDLDTINRVIVDVGNPLASTTAGRVQMADQLLQMKLLTSPEQYLALINTGNLNVMTRGQTDEIMTIKSENEDLVEGKNIIRALYSDAHSLHIREHKSVIADPTLRRDAKLISRVLDHMQEHIELLKNTDPNMLQLMGEQPLAPTGGSPIGPGGAAPQQVPQGAPSPAGNMSNPESTGQQGPNPNAMLPQPAKPAQVAGNVPNAADNLKKLQ
jgi:hypothetical protein